MVFLTRWVADLLTIIDRNPVSNLSCTAALKVNFILISFLSVTLGGEV